MSACLSDSFLFLCSLSLSLSLSLALTLSNDHPRCDSLSHTLSSILSLSLSLSDSRSFSSSLSCSIYFFLIFLSLYRYVYHICAWKHHLPAKLRDSSPMCHRLPPERFLAAGFVDSARPVPRHQGVRFRVQGLGFRV